MTSQAFLLRRSLIGVIITAAAFAVTSFPQKKRVEEVTITKCWSYPVQGGLAVASGDAGVYIARDGGLIEAVSLNGDRQWLTELGGTVVSNVEAKFASILVVTAAADGKGPQLRSLSTETGVVKWSVPVRAAKKYSILYFEVTAAVSGDDGTTEFFEASTGKPVSGSLTLQNDRIDGDELGNVVRSIDAKRIWKYRTGGAISMVIETNNAAIVASNDNFIYMISRERGHVRWKHRLPGRIGSMSRFGDDLLLVTAFDEHSLLLLDLIRGKASGRVILNPDESAIAVRPLDGRSFLLLTDTALYRYSIGNCTK